MIFSEQLTFSDDQAITADAASTNIIDLGAPGTPHGASGALVRDVGPGTAVQIAIIITETFNTLTSLDIAIEVDDNSGFSSATVLQTENVLLAGLAAGTLLDIPCQLPEGTNERYLRLNYNVNGTNPTTGAITAGVVAGRQTNF